MNISIGLKSNSFGPCTVLPWSLRRSEDPILSHPHLHLNRYLQQHQFLPSKPHRKCLVNLAVPPPRAVLRLPQLANRLLLLALPQPVPLQLLLTHRLLLNNHILQHRLLPSRVLDQAYSARWRALLRKYQFLYSTDTIAPTPYNHPLLLYTASSRTSTLILICSKRSTLTNTFQQRCSSWLIYRPCHRRLLRRWFLRTR